MSKEMLKMSLLTSSKTYVDRTGKRTVQVQVILRAIHFLELGTEMREILCLPFDSRRWGQKQLVENVMCRKRDIQPNPVPARLRRCVNGKTYKCASIGDVPIAPVASRPFQACHHKPPER